ncbi:hypothetical protein N7462_007132 [Penicillium macrosclerotiorum]|uniref:uncharacterized protein n=1 Tax=Penicillium macrosclerotiorum TaxID=303699 RepID=UPI0025490454|nr:uncharacterized protein N7462_007132 [Penicillium macrosclerotiorum]KAJ5678888.1 hypothetical protein N7462_007132 [Penicillium macrosclerotiorum]
MPRARFVNDDVIVSAFDISKIALLDCGEPDARINGVTGDFSEFTLFRTDTTNGHEYKESRHVKMDMNFDPGKEVILRGDSEQLMPNSI